MSFLVSSYLMSSNFCCLERQCVGTKFKKDRLRRLRLQFSPSERLWNAKWQNKKCPRVVPPHGCSHYRITNHFISMMYSFRWSTNMVTRLHGMANLRNAACQQHFQHQPTVKRKVETGVPNAMSSLAPEDPGSILAIVSMKIRTGWLGHPKQVHIPRIAKVSDPWPHQFADKAQAETHLITVCSQAMPGRAGQGRQGPRANYHTEKVQGVLSL